MHCRSVVFSAVQIWDDDIVVSVTVNFSFEQCVNATTEWKAHMLSQFHSDI